MAADAAGPCPPSLATGADLPAAAPVAVTGAGAATAPAVEDRPEPAPGEGLPRVSVIVPTNGARPALLEACLRALAALDYPADQHEVHVVDSGTGPDAERLVAEIAAGAAAPMRYTRRQGRTGPAASRHLGAEAATGDILAFIDDDCEAAPGWLRGAGAALADPGVGVVQGLTLPNPGHRRHLLEKTISVTGPSPFFETCNILYRRAAFFAAGGFSGPFAELFVGEDTDLGRRVLKAGWRRGFAPEGVVFHAVIPQTLGAWLMECWRVRNIPLLLRRWPEMRDDLCLRWFLSGQSAGFVVGVAGLALLPWAGAWALLAWLPYLGVRVAQPGRYRNPAAVLARAVLGVPRSAVTFAALVVGSVRHRCLVL